MKRPEPEEDRTAKVPSKGRQGAALSLGILPELIGRQLRIAHLNAFRDYEIEVDGISLTPGSFETLELLCRNPGLGQSRLAAAIGLDKSSLVPMISRLEFLELIERRPSLVDKRANDLRITPKGLRTLRKLYVYVRERDAMITEGMSRSEVETLNRLLTKIAQLR